ncbi:GntR family transcriptional regulator [Pacificibacter maritimus]|uniref:GntR family transcriptional regulator n=1 Tax=Pacificibacter maritimus TaxID=762213 RepID=A0A3N4ULP2_9RHOB|nr:FCD domain-containing protein [Pacificibacter maritimus]RPE62940.1 GntR family transcriptional regulator [Pacificibacter maritimus]
MTKRSQTDRDLASRLRLDIVSSAFEPESRLKFAELTKRYEVGIGTLREALTLLLSEGFVTVDAGKGFRVAPVSATELAEIIELYLELETRALEQAIKTGDDEWESTIVAAHHRLSLIESLPWEKRMERHEEWVERHREFHESLISACNSQWLVRLRSIMFNQLDRYRFITKLATAGRDQIKLAEHLEIKNAVLARDVPKAKYLLEAHIRDTAQHAIQKLTPKP